MMWGVTKTGVFGRSDLGFYIGHGPSLSELIAKFNTNITTATIGGARFSDHG